MKERDSVGDSLTCYAMYVVSIAMVSLVMLQCESMKMENGREINQLAFCRVLRGMRSSCTKAYVLFSTAALRERVARRETYFVLKFSTLIQAL